MLWCNTHSDIKFKIQHMVELDLTRAKQLMQDVATVLSKLMGGSSKSASSKLMGDVVKPQTFEEVKDIVSSINSGGHNGR